MKDDKHRTRTKQQLVRSCVSSNVISMSLCVYVITLWNALRTEINSKNSVNAFKKSYTKYIISDYEYLPTFMHIAILMFCYHGKADSDTLVYCKGPTTIQVL